VLGLAGDGDTSLLGDPLPERIALVLGNETEGLSEAVRAELDGTVSIPMHGGVESLNVASAAAVASYELLRRRTR
jgi:23S rRNA (guanosine2251-2'-O)-methyltransferase